MNGSRPPRRVLAAVVVAVAVAGVLVGLVVGRDAAGPAGSGVPPTAAVPVPDADPAGFRFERRSDPARTVVTDRAGVVVATFTDGARTVAVTGPPRTFGEPRFTPATVATTTWVRLAPQPWTAEAEQEPWVRPWLASALADTAPDVLAIAMEYLHDAPDAVDAEGVRYAGNASFGPEQSDRRRVVGSDFYDYLGLPWRFTDGVRKEPDPKQYRALDCSGYLRLVYGYRGGYPLLGGNSAGPGLPRRAAAIAESGPGALVLPDRGTRPTDLDRLQAGDLLFFTTDDERDIDHSAIYLGVDSDGEHRFVSSRSTADGPTLGDVAGPSVLDGDGLFADGFRAARRL